MVDYMELGRPSRKERALGWILLPVLGWVQAEQAPCQGILPSLL